MDVLQDKKYATDKYKDIYTELSIVRAKAERDLGRLREQLQQAHEALGEPTPEDLERSGYGTNPRLTLRSFSHFSHTLSSRLGRTLNCHSDAILSQFRHFYMGRFCAVIYSYEIDLMASDRMP